jgi:hypothetical protein
LPVSHRADPISGVIGSGHNMFSLRSDLSDICYYVTRRTTHKFKVFSDKNSHIFLTNTSVQYIAAIPIGVDSSVRIELCIVFTALSHSYLIQLQASYHIYDMKYWELSMQQYGD